MTKTKLILLWTLVIAYMAVSLGFVNQKEAAVNCHAIKIHILDSLENSFIDKTVIENIIKKYNSSILGTTLEKINTDFYEKKIRNHPAVKNCEVYTTIDGNLHVELEQRKPIVHVINRANQHYFIDQDGFVVPMVGEKSSLVLVANGEISENKEINFEKSEHISMFNAKGKQNMLKDIYTLARFIELDSFWNSQIVQIYVDRKGEVEVIPRIGAHVISLGSVENIETKFRNLKAMYVKGFNNIGWNEYEYINLKYKNQVICTKR